MTVNMRVRQIVMDAVARISALDDSENLFDAGLSSRDVIEVLIAIEEAFGIEIPDRLLRRETFASIHAIVGALRQMGVANTPSKPS